MFGISMRYPSSIKVVESVILLNFVSFCVYVILIAPAVGWFSSRAPVPILFFAPPVLYISLLSNHACIGDQIVWLQSEVIWYAPPLHFQVVLCTRLSTIRRYVLCSWVSSWNLGYFFYYTILYSSHVFLIEILNLEIFFQLLALARFILKKLRSIYNDLFFSSPQFSFLLAGDSRNSQLRSSTIDISPK